MNRSLKLAAGIACALVAAGPAAAQSAAQTRIFSAAGSGITGSTGDGSAATLGAVNYPRGLTAMPDGGFLVTEAFGNRVRRVTPDGRITAFAGSGVSGFAGDGGLATSARLNMPHGTVLLADGSVLIADTNNFRIRRVSPDGRISTVAGTGSRSFSGDGGAASAARISAPRGIGGTADGGYLIADSDNNRVRKVTAGGIITTVAGSGTRGYSGDGGPATTAALNAPYSVSALPDGTFFIADSANHRIRRVSPDGTMATVAGTGSAGFSGDGGQAVLAKLNTPHAVEAMPDGRLLIADMGNHRIRQVSSDGTITTVAGTGTVGFSGEAEGPLSARLFYPKAVLGFGSGLLVADADNYRVRFIGETPWPTPAPGSGVVFVDGAAAYAQTPFVSVGAPADGASQVRLSNSPTLSDGVLATGTTYPYSTPLAWDLTNPATGGSGAEGDHLVYAQWDRGDGTWSPVTADSIVLDTVAPTSTPPTSAFNVGSTLGITTIPVTLSWSGSDATSGLATHELQSTVDGGPPKITAGSATTSSQSLTAGPEYRFGVRGIDKAGNTGGWATAAPLRLSLAQESDSAVTFTGDWTQDSPTGASGGAVRYTTDPAGTAEFTFTGRSVAWVALLSASSGPAAVELDGVPVAAKVSLNSSSTVARRIVYTARWATAGQHVLRIKNAGAGTRIDVDAFAVGS